MTGLDRAGVGDPPSRVDLVRHRSIAALVSHIPQSRVEAQSARRLRQDMKAHAALLNKLAEQQTVLPFRFGVVFPDDPSVIARLLQPAYDRLTKLLEELDGAIELTLRATYVEQRVLQEVVAENPRLVSSSARRVRSYQARVDLGQRVARAIEAKQHHDAKRLFGVLRPFVRAAQFGRPLKELMLLNASMLVERASLPQFDRALAKIHNAEHDRIELDCIGPLPPYSFVDLEF